MASSSTCHAVPFPSASGAASASAGNATSTPFRLEDDTLVIAYCFHCRTTTRSWHASSTDAVAGDTVVCRACGGRDAPFAPPLTPSDLSYWNDASCRELLESVVNSGDRTAVAIVASTILDSSPFGPLVSKNRSKLMSRASRALAVALSLQDAREKHPPEEDARSTSSSEGESPREDSSDPDDAAPQNGEQAEDDDDDDDDDDEEEDCKDDSEAAFSVRCAAFYEPAPAGAAHAGRRATGRVEEAPVLVDHGIESALWWVPPLQELPSAFAPMEPSERRLKYDHDDPTILLPELRKPAPRVVAAALAAAAAKLGEAVEDKDGDQTIRETLASGTTFVSSENSFQCVASELYDLRRHQRILMPLALRNAVLSRTAKPKRVCLMIPDGKGARRVLELTSDEWERLSPTWRRKGDLLFSRTADTAWMACWQFRPAKPLGADGVDASSSRNVKTAFANEVMAARAADSPRLRSLDMLWRRMRYEQRLEFLTKRLRLALRGTNHANAFLMYPMFRHAFGVRDPRYAMLPFRREWTWIEPTSMMRLCAMQNSLDFLLDFATFRLDMSRLDDIPKRSSIDGSYSLRYAQLLVSWTLYRGIILQMVGAGLEALLDRSEEKAQRAAEALLAPPPPPPAPVPKMRASKPKKKKARKPRTSPSPPPPPPPLIEETPSPPADLGMLGGFCTLLDNLHRCTHCGQRDYDCVPVACGHLHACRQCLESSGSCFVCGASAAKLIDVKTQWTE